MKLLLNVDITSLSDLILINFTLANVNDNLGNKMIFSSILMRLIDYAKKN